MTIEQRFTEQLEAILSGLFGRGESDGYPGHVLDAADQRIGGPLPGLLRRCYLIAGKHPALSSSLQNLVAPGELSVQELRMENEERRCAALVFLEEQQGVTWSALRHDSLSQEDPLVYQVDPDEAVMYAERRTLSTFLLETLCWNSTELCPSSHWESVGPGERRRLRSVLARARCGSVDRFASMEAYFGGSVVAVMFRRTDPVGGRRNLGWDDLYLASRTAPELRAFEERIRGRRTSPPRPATA